MLNKEIIRNTIVTDVETGGLHPDTDALLQIGFTPLDKELREKIGTLNILINHPGEIHDSALACNGLTREQIATGLSVDDAKAEIKEYFTRLREECPEVKKFFLAGHNVHFDLGFLNKMFPYKERDWTHRVVDSHTLLWLMIATGLIPPLPENVSASDYLFDYFQIKVDGRHTALGDAEATRTSILQVLDIYEAN